MVDCGLAYSHIKPDLYKTKIMLLTHTHSDHIKPTTLKRIQKEFPSIKIYGNYEVAYNFNGINIVNENIEVPVNGYKITPFSGIHDVLTYGFTWTADGERIIYATDMADFRNAPPGPYDYLFLESNHDQKKLEQARGNAERTYGYNAYFAGLRHCSTQTSKAFYYMNRRDKESQWIELHKSKRFY